MSSKVTGFVKQYNVELIFTLICFLIYTLWAATIPFNTGPDELMRFQVVDFIYKNGYLPTGSEIEIRNEFWGISYGFTPTFSYFLSSLFLRITDNFTEAPKLMVFAARLVSVLASTVTALFLILISKKCFKGLNQWIFVILVAFLPQFVFISSYVNNDALAIMSTAIIFYSWIIGLERAWDVKSCLLLGIGISLCALSYYNAYGFILCSMIIFIGTNLKQINAKSIKKTIFSGSLITGVVVILAGWWFIRSAIIHQGDILGMRTLQELSERYAIDMLKPSLRGTPMNLGVSIFEMIFGRINGFNWIDTSYRSFIGYFGYMSIMLDDYMYNIYSVIYLFGLVGLYYKIKESVLAKKNSVEKVILYFCIGLAILIPIILSIYYSYSSDYQPQGRYLLPMIIPLSFLLTKGISQFKLIINGKIIPGKQLIILGYIGLLIIIYCNKIAYIYL